jgi:cytochrome P450 family 142 subfamily A polypeptide 1
VAVSIAFLSSASWDDQMPEHTRWLREHDPVHWSEPDGLWVVSRFEDVSYVSKNQALFTSAGGVRPNTPVKLALIDEGEPRHTSLRRLINRGFTPRMVAKLEKVFLEITTEAIDAVAPRGECDFVEDIAVPLPLLLIAEMIGIRREDRDDFHRWSDTMISADGRLDDPEVVQRSAAAFQAYSSYCTSIIEDRRKEPRDDLVSILVGAKDEGTLGELDAHEPAEGTEEQMALANDELIMMLVLLMVAGNETTRNGLSGGMQLLIENPGERQKLIDDPGLIPSAVEEMVRVISPVHSFSRTVTQDTEIGGKALRKGDKVLMLYPSANHDERVFEEPDRFRVDRNPHHLGFGIGTHFCLGANLARMEMRVAFAELLRRLPDMEYSAGGPEILPSALVRSCTHMYLRFTPEGEA